MQQLKEFLRRKDEEHGGEPLDLSMLLAHVLPYEVVQEPADAWNEDRLLTEVASELQQRRDDRGGSLTGSPRTHAPLAAGWLD